MGFDIWRDVIILNSDHSSVNKLTPCIFPMGAVLHGGKLYPNPSLEELTCR